MQIPNHLEKKLLKCFSLNLCARSHLKLLANIPPNDKDSLKLLDACPPSRKLMSTSPLLFHGEETGVEIRGSGHATSPWAAAAR